MPPGPGRDSLLGHCGLLSFPAVKRRQWQRCHSLACCDGESVHLNKAPFPRGRQRQEARPHLASGIVRGVAEAGSAAPLSTWSLVPNPEIRCIDGGEQEDAWSLEDETRWKRSCRAEGMAGTV